MFVSGIVTVNEDLAIISGALLNFIMFAYWIKDLKKTHNRNRERKRKYKEKSQKEKEIKLERHRTRERNHPVETDNIRGYFFNNEVKFIPASSSSDTIKRIKLKKNDYHTYISLRNSLYSITNLEGTFNIYFAVLHNHSLEKKIYEPSYEISDIKVNGYIIYRDITDEESLLVGMQDILLRMAQVNAEEPLVIKNFLKLCSHIIEQNNYHRNNPDNEPYDVRFWLTDDEGLMESREVLYPGYEHKLKKYVELIYSNAEMIYEKVYNELYKNDEMTTNHVLFYLQILEMTDISNPSIEEIKKQYRKLAKKYHPDIENGDEKHFRLITKAYEGILKEYSK